MLDRNFEALLVDLRKFCGEFKKMSQQELCDAIQMLTSNKKRERLVALETLTVLLRRDDILSLLNQKQNESSISWNIIFLKVHNAILADLKKAEAKNTSIVDKQLQTMQNIIFEISQKSVNGEVPFLDCDTVICCILSVFESSFKMKCLGSAYTDLLLKYILGHRKFWGEIKLEHWTEMKNLCKMCFQNPPPKTQSVTYLNALSDIIRLSCKNLMISQNFLDIFTFVSNVFTSYTGSLCGYGASLLRLVNILCLQLATEFRYKVCSFMEEIFDFVLSFYDKKKNNKNSLIYHFLITYLNVHNPNGVNESDESFYAFNEEKWRQQIMSIYSLTQESTKELLRNPEKTELEVGFMDLVVDINYLVSVCGLDRFENLSGIPEEDEYSESPTCSNKRKRSFDFSQSWSLEKLSGGRIKKLKRSNSFSQILEDLLTPDAWFWIIFLELLLQKYPQILGTRFKQIIEILSKLLHDCLDPKISQDVCRCLSIILSKEKYYAEQITDPEGSYLNEIWNKVGVELIRLFKIDNSPEYHRLMRYLIINSKFWDPVPLINLYHNEVFGTNVEDFLTLFTVCQNCILPESLTGIELNDNGHCVQVRLHFLKWLFRDRVRYPTKELSKILITLILNKSEEDNDIPLTKTTETLIISKNIGDFCKLITSTYETVSMKNLRFVQDVKPIETIVTPKIDTRMQSELFTCLQDRLNELNNELLDDEKPWCEKINTIRDSLHYSESLLHFYSHLMYLGVKINDQDVLLGKLKPLIFLTTNKSYQVLQHKYFGLVEFFHFYSATYHTDLNKIIRNNDCIHIGFLQHLFKMFKEGFMKSSSNNKGKKDDLKTENISDGKLNSAFSTLITNPRSILHIDCLSEEEKKVIEVLEVLCHFIIIPGCLEKNRLQKTLEINLFEELRREDVLNLSSNFHLQIVLRIAYNFSKFDGIDSDALQNNLNLLLLIFEYAKYDSEIAVVILQIMKGFIHLSSRTCNKDCESILLFLINGFRKMILEKKRFGISVIVKFIEFLTGMVKCDWNEESLFYKEKNEIYALCRDIILFLKHPYYEVRLFAAQHIGTLFSVPKNNEGIIGRQRKMINLVKTTLMDDENVVAENNTTSLVFPYHQVVGMTVMIISWTTIICLSSYWRRSALFYLIELAYIRRFSQNKLCRATSLIFKELNVKNGEKFIAAHLPYLMKRWAEAGYELEDFPAYILGCQSLHEFLQRYSNILLPILLWNGNLLTVDKISNDMNITIKRLVQECYPELISIILPSLSENIESQTVMKANKLKNFMDKELGTDSSSLIAKYIDKVIFRIFCYMEDNSYLSDLCQTEGYLFEESSSIRFTVNQIAEILENASQTEGRTFLGEIVLENPRVIQKVLILLSYEVELACIFDDKIVSFGKYIAFVEILSNTTRQAAFRNIITFIIRDVISTLDSFIQSCQSRKITTMALRCLKVVLKNYVVEFSDIICDFLSVITILCQPLVLEGYNEAYVILKFLICDNFEKLQSATTTLDPFPTETVFVEMNNVLEKNKRQWTNIKDSVRHFLSVASRKRGGLEGLKCLHDALTTRKEELKMLCDELNCLRGFSEECKKSLLHQLICTLIELTGDKNVSIRTEAAKCLGELGPLDLTTLVLKPGNHLIKTIPNESPVVRLLKLCIHELSDLVVNENLEIRMAASDLTYIILESQDGMEILEEQELKLKNYLLPFQSKTKKTLVIKNNSIKLKNNMSEHNLWIPTNHEDWIKTLVKLLLKSFTDSNGLIEAMLKMVEISWQFAEKVFPIILDVILSFRDEIRTEIITANLSAFFREFFDLTGKKLPAINLRSLQCMVNVVDYLRIHRNYDGTYEEFDLKINYLHVAEAARYCSAFFTSILYVELWFNEKKKLEDNLTIDKICELYPEEGSTLTKILGDCYSKIGILDGVQGCGYMHLLDLATESRRFENLNKWDISMVYHDIELSRGYSQSEHHLMNSLLQSGMFYSLSRLIQSSSNLEELRDIQYKCATSLSDWNLIPHKWSNNNTIDSYEKGRYFALKAFHDDDQPTFLNEIHKARRCTINKLSCSSLESVDNLYQFLSELRCLKELEDFGLVIKAVSNVNDIDTIFCRWCLQDTIKFSNHKFIEDILTQRIVLLKEEMQRNKNPAVTKLLHLMICKSYYKLIKTARKEKRYAIAYRHLSYISRFENLPDSIAGKIKIEKSYLEWEIGEAETGIFLLRNYLKRDEIKGELKAKALKIYGDWMASTNSENARSIIEEYYLKSIEMAQRPKDRMNSYASLAKFADSNYEQVKEFQSSPLYEIKKNIINRQQDIASELRQEIDWNQDKEKKIAYRLVERQSVIDENEIKNNENEKNLFLSLAVQYYLLSLKEGEKYDLLVFRLISLWFSNLDHDNVIARLKEYLYEIPTHKFLCLLPQIVPRMAEIGLISTLVERTLLDHPYHTLPILFALANSFEDSKYGGTKPTSYSQRALVARSILEKYQKDQKLKPFIVEMNQFCDAMIELANTSPAGVKCAKVGTLIAIPSELKISRLRNLSNVPVPSLTIPCQKSCNYNNVTGIKCIEQQYQLVGGINIPKKIKCIGLDGISRSLLVKGRDDLRQDAVMQQVFTIMNSLLHRNTDTSRKKLVIRTYKVVPLSHRSGVIEWCENTQPLSLYLIGPDAMSGAHRKFYPEDITALECRSRIRKVFQSADVTNDLKLKVYLDICSKFRPVFRHFFFENFPEPGVWFERRLAYTHSVATSSMIGYILGIGDRHVQNILIDNATAEVIHIDLGIAFEQGKTLPTPETVPFRLTRDIVDGMGISGVEGVFRLSCIKTMKVLRENQHAILTLLEVLLYDPLYAWTITAEKAFIVQGHEGTESSSEKNSTEIEINKMAERALIRLKQKLQGIETGGVATNVEGQVNCLIQQARDPNNLCRLFHGWQAYL